MSPPNTLIPFEFLGPSEPFSSPYLDRDRRPYPPRGSLLDRGRVEEYYEDEEAMGEESKKRRERVAKNLLAWLRRKMGAAEVERVVGDIREEVSVGDGSVDGGSEDEEDEREDSGYERDDEREGQEEEEEEGDDGEVVDLVGNIQEEVSDDGYEGEDEEDEKVDSLVGEDDEGEEKVDDEPIPINEDPGRESIQAVLIKKAVQLVRLKALLIEAIGRHSLYARRPDEPRSGDAVDATPPPSSTRRPDLRFWRRIGEELQEKEKGRKMALCMERYREARRGVELLLEEEGVGELVGDGGDDKERREEYQMWCERWEEGLW